MKAALLRLSEKFKRVFFSCATRGFFFQESRGVCVGKRERTSVVPSLCGVGCFASNQSLVSALCVENLQDPFTTAVFRLCPDRSQTGGREGGGGGHIPNLTGFAHQCRTWRLERVAPEVTVVTRFSGWDGASAGVSCWSAQQNPARPPLPKTCTCGRVALVVK